VNNEEFKKYVFKRFNFSSDINIPLYKESKNPLGWVNFGQANDMPDYYLGLLARSAKHNAIVNTKAKLIAGNGWLKTDLNNESLMFIKNPYGEFDLDEVVSRAAFDFEVFGGMSLEIIWNNDRQSIKAINHIPVQKVRCKAKDPEAPNEKGYFLCDDWKKSSRIPIVEITPFSTINRKDLNQLLYAKRYVPGRENYGEPLYMPAARWCELEFEVSNFHLSSAKNGFTPGMHINIPIGIPNEDMIEREMSRLRKEFEGTSNGSAPFITFSDGSDNAITIQPLNLNDSDQRFIQLNQEITEGIMTGHCATSPSLFGVMQQGMIINKANTISDLQQFQSMYVNPVQEFIEKIFARLCRMNSVSPIKLQKYEFDFDAQLSTSDLMSILTSALPPEQKVQVLISSGYREEEADKLVESGSPTPTGANGLPVEQEQASINDNIKNLTGRQHQSLMRILKQFAQGKITKEQATVLLKSGLGLSDDDITMMLADDSVEEPNKIIK
jgi:hypothetical protein